MATSSNANANMQYSFLIASANDGTIDSGELAMFERLALEDGTVDAQEREMLSRIFARVTRKSVAEDVWAEICRFKAEHQIPQCPGQFSRYRPDHKVFDIKAFFSALLQARRTTKTQSGRRYIASSDVRRGVRELRVL